MLMLLAIGTSCACTTTRPATAWVTALAPSSREQGEGMLEQMNLPHMQACCQKLHAHAHTGIHTHTCHQASMFLSPSVSLHVTQAALCGSHIHTRTHSSIPLVTPPATPPLSDPCRGGDRDQGGQGDQLRLRNCTDAAAGCNGTASGAGPHAHSQQGAGTGAGPGNNR
jgi:hypothetical protein